MWSEPPPRSPPSVPCHLRRRAAGHLPCGRSDETEPEHPRALQLPEVRWSRRGTNTVKWNIASGAVNAMTRSIEQAWGYVKNLDTSLNDIRIVTGKSADEMANFAVQANNAAQTLGRTTTDYTKAALIYAQQGNGPKIFEANA